MSIRLALPNRRPLPARRKHITQRVTTGGRLETRIPMLFPASCESFACILWVLLPVPAIGYAAPIGYPENRSANVKKKCSHSKSRRGTQPIQKRPEAEPLMPVKGDHERFPSTR